MRNTNAYAWTWISWAWIPCYLSMDYLNYRFSPLFPTMPPSRSWGCCSHPCLQGWLFRIALVFLTSFSQPYLFGHSPPSQKRFICPKVCVCSLKISCLSRIEDKKWTEGHLADWHQDTQRRVTDITHALRAPRRHLPRFGARPCPVAKTRAHLLAKGGQPCRHTPAVPASWEQAVGWLSLQKGSRLRILAGSWLFLVLSCRSHP